MNVKQFHTHVTPYLLKLNDKKYHLNEHKLLEILEEDRLYKVYQAYLKEEEIKHSNKELNKFLDYYCQVISSKKIKNAFQKFNKNKNLVKIAALPALLVPLAPFFTKAAIATGVWIAAAVTQAIAEELKNANTLIEAAEEISEQLTEFNQDYGFGESQQQADRLASNLKLLISLFPVVSSTPSQSSDAAEIQKFMNDTSKFLTALYEIEKDIIVINSYLTEHKGAGTHAVDLLRGMGLSLGFETDAISLTRAIGNFQSHSGACRIKLEKKVSEISRKLKPHMKRIEMDQSQDMPEEELSEEAINQFEEELPEEPVQMPKRKSKSAPAARYTATEPSTSQDFDDEISEFANLTF